MFKWRYVKWRGENVIFFLGGSINYCKEQYSSQFKLNDKIYYKGYKGIITFEHDKEFIDRSIKRFSVLINGIEYRYVKGCDIIKRDP